MILNGHFVEGDPINPPPAKGVYILQISSKVVKIGHASHIRNRVSSIGAHTTFEVKLLAWLDGLGSYTEGLLHAKHWRDRIKSKYGVEKFLLSQAVIQTIVEIRSGLFVQPAMSLPEVHYDRPGRRGDLLRGRFVDRGQRAVDAMTSLLVEMSEITHSNV